MKIITRLLFLFTLFFISSNIAYATVGGPTYIGDFKYNPKDESIYYKFYDHGGRGCPPVLMKISLNDGKTNEVYSCDEGEKFLESYQNDYNVGIAKLAEELDKITSGFKDLTPINLKKNNINIDIKFARSEKFEGELDMIKNSIFNAEISKDNNKLLFTDIFGCNIEQPFTFAGYSIPGFNKKIVILNSSKANCFEGGYINESLIVVGGLDNINKESLNFYKGDMALVPNEGTITVYASNSDTKNIADDREVKIDVKPLLSNHVSTSTVTINLFKNKIVIAIFCTIIASIFLGFFLGRVSKRQ